MKCIIYRNLPSIAEVVGGREDIRRNPLHRVQHLLRPRPYDQAAAPTVHFPHAEPAAQRRQRRHLLHSEHIQELANHARRQRGHHHRRRGPPARHHRELVLCVPCEQTSDAHRHTGTHTQSNKLTLLVFQISPLMSTKNQAKVQSYSTHV